MLIFHTFFLPVETRSKKASRGGKNIPTKLTPPVYLHPMPSAQYY